MSEPYDQDAEAVYEAIRDVYGELRPQVWVDTVTGAWGTDITSVMALRLVDGQDMTEFAALSDRDRVALAKAVGLPIRMLGCTNEHKE